MFQIITDSCCDIPYQVLEAQDIAFIPMFVEIDGQEYLDDLGKTFDYTAFLQALKDKKMPTTSQINVGRYVEFFRPYCEKGIPVLYVGFTSGMSGSYSSAMQAVEILKDDFPDPQVTVIDSLGASLGEGLLVLGAQRQQAAGKSLEEVAAWVEANKMTVQSWVTVDDLMHLLAGGRISKTAATVGSLLSVKPIINVSAEGKLDNVGKVRGRRRALETIVQETVANLASKSDQIVYIAYSGEDTDAKKALALLQEQIEISEEQIYPLGPTIASHTGLGCVAIFTFGKDRSR